MSVTRIWSDHRFVTSSTASADSAACTTWRGPRTAIRPWATSRSTRTRPESLVPRDTRPGYGASGPVPPTAPPVSGASRPAMAANGSRHTWPPSAACHGRGGFGSGGATHRSRFWRPRWAANTVGGVRPAAPSCRDRYRRPVSSIRTAGSSAPSRRAFSASAASGSGPAIRRPNARCHSCSRRLRPSAASTPAASSEAADSS